MDFRDMMVYFLKLKARKKSCFLLVLEAYDLLPTMSPGTRFDFEAPEILSINA